MATAQAGPAFRSISQGQSDVNPYQNGKDLISASALVGLLEAAAKSLTPIAALAVALVAVREAAADAWGETSRSDLIRSLAADRKTIARPESGVLAQAFRSVGAGRYRLNPRWRLGNFSRNPGIFPEPEGKIPEREGEIIPFCGKNSQTHLKSTSTKKKESTCKPYPTVPTHSPASEGVVGEVSLESLVGAMVDGIPGTNAPGARVCAGLALRTASNTEISDLLAALQNGQLADLCERPHMLSWGKNVITNVVGRILTMIGGEQIPRLLDLARRAAQEANAARAEEEARAAYLEARLAEAKQSWAAAVQAHPAMQGESDLRDAYLGYYAGEVTEAKLAAVMDRCEGCAPVPASVPMPVPEWECLRRALASKLPESTFQDWIEPCRAMIFDGSTLWIQTPSPSARVWIEQQLAEDFHDALVHCGMSHLRLAFVVSETNQIAGHLKALGLRVRKDFAC